MKTGFLHDIAPLLLVLLHYNGTHNDVKCDEKAVIYSYRFKLTSRGQNCVWPWPWFFGLGFEAPFLSLTALSFESPNDLTLWEWPFENAFILAINFRFLYCVLAIIVSSDSSCFNLWLHPFQFTSEAETVFFWSWRCNKLTVSSVIKSLFINEIKLRQ